MNVESIGKTAAALGEITGYTYRLGKSVIQSLWAKIRGIVNLLILSIVIVFAVPPIVQYWLSRTRIPEIPVSAIIGMAVGAFLLIAFSASMYMIVHVIRSIVLTEGSVSGSLSRRRQPSTEGQFIPTDDGKLWEAEQVAHLKRQGILHETDVEDLASELGHREILKNRGKEAT